MPRPSLPPVLDLAPFRVGEALALGVGEKRLRAPRFAVPFHGVRSPRPVETLLERCSALVPTLRPGAVFSHTTAAALWGLPVPLGTVAGDLHVVSAVGDRRRRGGVIVHAQTAPVRGHFVSGVPVVGPLVAWAQCGGVLPLDDLVAMGDALAGRWSSYSMARERPLAELDGMVTARAGRRGAGRLRAARRLVRAGVWSPKETELRLLIVRAGLPEPPELNGPVTDSAGEVLGHADLVYRDHGVVFEYEGDGHRTSRAQWRRDIARYECFQDAGWRVVRVTDDDLVEPRILLARLARNLTDAPGAAPASALQ